MRRSHRRWISIHAPREGSDLTEGEYFSVVRISIHAPREGSDENAGSPLRSGHRFQSTLPARGATSEFIYPTFTVDFNPRSPRGERHCLVLFPIKSIQFQSTLPARGATGGFFICRKISPRFQSTLPARGATTAFRYAVCIDGGFQSTLPARGATCARPPSRYCAEISIHAPREGSDNSTPKRHLFRIFISIHAPREGSDLRRV